MGRYQRYRRSKKPLCIDSLLLSQEAWHSVAEIAEAMRVSSATLYRWRRLYGFPAPFLGKRVLTTRTAVAEWILRMAASQRKASRKREARRKKLLEERKDDEA